MSIEHLLGLRVHGDVEIPDGEGGWRTVKPTDIHVGTEPPADTSLLWINPDDDPPLPDGLTNLSQLDDVSVGDAQEGDLLQFDGIDWVPVAADFTSSAELDRFRSETNVRLWQLEADVLGEVEQFAGWHGEAFLEGQDAVASESGDISVSRGARLLDGSASLASLSTLPDGLQDAIDSDDFGAEVAGGFFAGVIDPDPGGMDAGEVYTTPQRYALIVAPQSLTGGRDSGTGDLEWCDSSTNVPDARTRWNGLAATQAMLDANLTNSIADYVDGLNTSDPPPDDGGSPWYIPALDELDLIYRMLKPTSGSNDTAVRDSDFPAGQYPDWGNPSSDPQFDPITSGDPPQTDVAAFQEGGDQAFAGFTDWYWSSSEGSDSDAWFQYFAFLPGRQHDVTKTNSNGSVRPVRRVELESAPLASLPDENTPIGEEIAGGFFAGVIDTDANSADIDPNDTRQTGKRYALIVSPKAIGEPSSNLRWRTSMTGVAEARTRWDGLYVTDYIIGGNAGSLSDFPIFDFCNDVRTSDPVPDDGGSDWYIPAMDELLLLYRNLKPGTEDNDVRERDPEFPDLFQQGENPSSDPQGTAYTASDPQQTTVTAFQGGGAETLQFEADGDNNRLWSATEESNDRAWPQSFRGSTAGFQTIINKDNTLNRCRLVRRVELD